nr:class C sortase [uncultured Blautia sp.]
MKKKRGNILIPVMFLLGLLTVFYPSISNFWNQHLEKKLMDNYETVVQQLDQEDLSKEMEAARAYNRSHQDNRVPDAFAEGEVKEDAEYENLLNVDKDGVMAILEIPCINVKLPVFHGTGDEALQKGAGHLIGSSLPVGGEGSHCVIAAHRGLPSAALFTDLNLVKEGDLFFIQVLGETLAYKVDQIKVVEPEETESLQVVKDKDYVTLVTCTPYGVNTQRLLVRGVRTEYTPDMQSESGETRKSLATSYVLAAALSLLLVLVVAVLLLRKGKKKKDKDKKDKDKNEMKS